MLGSQCLTVALRLIQTMAVCSTSALLGEDLDVHDPTIVTEAVGGQVEAQVGSKQCLRFGVLTLEWAVAADNEVNRAAHRAVAARCERRSGRFLDYRVQHAAWLDQPRLSSLGIVLS